MSNERHPNLNLEPPEEDFELYRHQNAEQMTMCGWLGLYWARNSESGDYEIRAVTKEGKAHSVTGRVFPMEGFGSTTRR